MPNDTIFLLLYLLLGAAATCAMSFLEISIDILDGSWD